MCDSMQHHQQAAEYDAWFRLQVQQGIAEADAGKVIPHHDAEARFAARRESVRSKLGIRDLCV